MWNKKKGASELVREVLKLASPLLPEKDVLEASELLGHNEWGEALDLICTQLYEHDAVVQRALVDRVREAGSAMGLGEDTWPFLEEMVGE